MRKRLRESYEDFVIRDGVLKEYRGTDIDVVIPNEVTKVDDFVFAGNTKIQSITGKSVKEIGYRAFALCKNLLVIEFPYVAVIQAEAFQECYNLISLSLPSVKRVGKYAFDACKSIETVYMPILVSLNECAFCHCYSLEEITIPSSAWVARDAFYGTPIEDDIAEQLHLTEAVEDKDEPEATEPETKETETPDVEKMLRSMVKKYDGILQYGASFGEDEKQFMVAFDDETGKWIALDDNNEMIGDTDVDNLEDFIKELLEKEQ